MSGNSATLFNRASLVYDLVRESSAELRTRIERRFDLAICAKCVSYMCYMCAISAMCHRP